MKFLLNMLEKESAIAIKWFYKNNMVVNLAKYYAFITNRLGKVRDSYNINIGGKSIASTKSVTHLSLQIDSRLNFDLQV